MRILPMFLCVATLINGPTLYGTGSAQSTKSVSPTNVAALLLAAEEQQHADEKRSARSETFKRYLLLLLLSISFQIALEARWNISGTLRNSFWPDQAPQYADAAALAKAETELQALKEQLADAIATQAKIPAEQQRFFDRVLTPKIAETEKKLQDKIAAFEAAAATTDKECISSVNEALARVRELNTAQATLTSQVGKLSGLTDQTQRTVTALKTTDQDFLERVSTLDKQIKSTGERIAATEARVTTACDSAQKALKKASKADHKVWDYTRKTQQTEQRLSQIEAEQKKNP